VSLEYLRVSMAIQYLPYYTPPHLTEFKAGGKWKPSVEGTGQRNTQSNNQLQEKANITETNCQRKGQESSKETPPISKIIGQVPPHSQNLQQSENHPTINQLLLKETQQIGWGL
jgi:hypothetical protein